MKKILLILMLFILSISFASAQELLVTTNILEDRAQPGNTASFEIAITNNNFIDEVFKIKADELGVYPFSDTLESVKIGPDQTLEYSVEVPAYQVRTIKVDFKILRDAKPDSVFRTPIIIESLTSKEKVIKEFIIDIITPGDLISISTNFPEEFIPGDTITFDVNLINRVNLAIEEIEVRILSELFEKKFTTPVLYRTPSSKKISLDFPPTTKPGTYTITIKAYEGRELKGSLIREFTVIQNPDVEEKIDRTSTFLTETLLLSKKNNGNLIVEESFILPTSKFKNLFTKTEPDPVIKSKNTLQWVFELKPNESYAIKVTTDYTSLFIVIVALLIILLTVIYFKTKKVTINKSALKVKDVHGSISELKVVLHIRNRDQDLKDVHIYDLVPNIVKVVGEYGTIKPDKKQRGRTGVRLIWKIPELKKGEERIISYKVESKLHIVGSLSLPRAMVKYKKGRRTVREKSNRLVFFATSKKR